MDLPPAAELIQLVKENGDDALDAYAPQIDKLVDSAKAGPWVGIKAGSISRKRQRTRVDGTPEWPAPDDTFGRSPVWSYRTLVVHLAAAPGRGHPGMARGPRKPTEAC